MENENKELETKEIIVLGEIKNLIYTIRGKQVMLDSDVAMLYRYETKRVNEAVKRNKERFPENFCFQLTNKEFNILKSQFATSKIQGGKQKLPNVFTEQGIIMLAGLLKNEIAVEVSVKIVEAFVEMRKFIMSNAPIFERLTNVEYKLLEHDRKFDEVFNELQKDENFSQKIFFQGQIYDAYNLIVKLIKRANKKIVIIDNYIDESILEMLSKKNKNVEVRILTSNKSNILKLDVEKFNKEYPLLKISKTDKYHDRFIIIDDKELYHLGASIKDLGNKCFGINKIEDKEIIGKFIA